MDAAQFQQFRDGLAKECMKIYECEESEEFKKALSQCSKKDQPSYMSPKSSVFQHYVYKGVSLTPTLLRGVFESEDLKLSPDDLVLASFPKTGTTWVQQIIYLILNKHDIQKHKTDNIDEKFPYLEFPECTMKVLKAKTQKSVKTHLPYRLLPDGGSGKKYKIIYTTRNPKDTLVSMYHFYRMLKSIMFVGDEKDMFNMFLNDGVIYSPFPQHVQEYWDHRNDDNVLIVKYEDLQKDPKQEIRRIAKFINEEVSEEIVSEIVNASSFSQMASNPQSHHGQWDDKKITDSDTSKFMRKGKVGDWKNHFDAEQNKRIDEWIAKNFPKDGIQFDYEI